MSIDLPIFDYYGSRRDILRLTVGSALALIGCSAPKQEPTPTTNVSSLREVTGPNISECSKNGLIPGLSVTSEGRGPNSVGRLYILGADSGIYTLTVDPGAYRTVPVVGDSILQRNFVLQVFTQRADPQLIVDIRMGFNPKEEPNNMLRFRVNNFNHDICNLLSLRWQNQSLSAVEWNGNSIQ